MPAAQKASSFMYEFMKNKLSDLFFTFSLLQHIIVNLICKLTFNIYYHNTIKGVKKHFSEKYKTSPNPVAAKNKTPFKYYIQRAFYKILYQNSLLKIKIKD